MPNTPNKPNTSRAPLTDDQLQARIELLLYVAPTTSNAYHLLHSETPICEWDFINDRLARTRDKYHGHATFIIGSSPRQLKVCSRCVNRFWAKEYVRTGVNNGVPNSVKVVSISPTPFEKEVMFVVNGKPSDVVKGWDELAEYDKEISIAALRSPRPGS